MSNPRTAEEKARDWRAVKGLIAVLGKWEIGPEEVKFTQADDERYKLGIAVSSVRTADGDFRAKVRLSETEEGCAHFVLGHDSETRSGLTVGLGGFDQAYSVSRYWPRLSKSLVGFGRKDNLEPGREYQIEAALRGQLLVFRVDGTEVLRYTLPPLPGNQFGIKGYGSGDVTFKEIEARVEKPSAFIVMQFSEPYNSLWKEVIRPVARKAGFRPHRADDVLRPGVVLQDIVAGIAESQVVIAEVTPPNPNVFYELGYARAIGKPVVLLVEEPREGAKPLPFDISGFRCIFYEDAIRGKSKIERTLTKYLRNISQEVGVEEDGEEEEEDWDE